MTVEDARVQGTYERITRWVTFFLIKVTQAFGVALGVNEMLIRPETQTIRLAFAAFVISGAQGFESIAKYAIDRAFSVEGGK